MRAHVHANVFFYKLKKASAYMYIQKQNQQNIIGTVSVKFHAVRILFF